MKKDNNLRHFVVHNGQFTQVASNDRSIQYWNPDSQEYQYLSRLSVKVYKKDLHVSDSFRRKYKEEKVEIKKRGIIKKYSFGASRRCKFFIRNTSHLMEYMVNLTYPNDYPMDGLLVKKQLHKFLSWLRYHEYRYLWVLEFQERGAPHFHLLVDKEIDQKDVRAYWYKMVNSGDKKHLTRGATVEPIRSKGGMGHYLTSYLEKVKQKIVPPEYEKVGRFWGHSDNLLSEDKMRIYGSREEISALKKQLKVGKQYDKAQKKSWEKKAREKAGDKYRKNKFKKFYSGYTGFSLKLTNADKLYDELLRRDIILWPYRLTGTPPLPPAPTNVVPWQGSVPEVGKRDEPRTQKLGIESDEELLRKWGLY